MRLGATFVAVCMALIAVSVGAVAYLAFGFTGTEATIAAVAALSGLGLLNSSTARDRDRTDARAQIADLSRGTADLARQVGEMSRRLAAVESDVASAAAKARAATEPLSAEIGMLGTLIKELAESVAAQDTALAAVRAAPAAAAPALAASPAPSSPGGGQPATAPAQSVAAPAVEPIDPMAAQSPDPRVQAEDVAATEAPAPTSGRFKGLADAEVQAIVRRAIEGNRVDLYLQPIVTLPQRKVRYYEALTRLRSDDGELLAPADFMGHAENGGLMPALDNLLLFRCVQVVRRLQTKNREIGLFCNVSASTLLHADLFGQILEFLEGNRVLASAIVLEFTQKAVRGMGPIELASLAALAEIGYRFSMDGMTDLHVEPREFAERGFRFIKAPARMLLRRTGLGSDIHPADFSDLLGRFGIDLIAERIENEGTVVDLLDYDVRFGQGFLFSPPRPVRSEVLQGIVERPSMASPGGGRPASELPPVRGPEPLPADAKSSADRRSTMAQLARGTVRRA